MSTTRTTPTTKTVIAFAILTTCGLTALAYRIWRASHLGLLEALTSAGTGLLLIAAVAAGWTAHTRNLRVRVETAEWEAALAKRADTLLDGEEDRKLWESVEPAGNDEDTLTFGKNVVALVQKPQRQAKAG